MAKVKIAFIDPAAVLGALTPAAIAAELEELGPSGPHEFDEELEEAEPVTVKATLIPGLSASLGAAPLPIMAAHYTDVLDDLWPEFDDPEERTAARLESLLDEVADEAQRVHLLAQDIWEDLPFYKVPDSVRQQYDREFLAYLRRLNGYRTTLRELEPESTATESVYIGLVKRQKGAGPVPDAIMHVYFAQMLGILSDHADDMGKGFVGRVLDGLAQVDRVIDDAAEGVYEAEDAAVKKLDDWWSKVTRPWKWAAGILVGSLVVIGGSVAIMTATNPPKEREP